MIYIYIFAGKKIIILEDENHCQSCGRVYTDRKKMSGWDVTWLDAGAGGTTGVLGW